MNRDTAIAQANLNRIDQYTPQGSITYDQTGMNTDGTPQYRQTQTYSPGQQQLYDQQTQIANALNGLAGSNVQRVADVQAQPFSYDGMTPQVSGVNAGALRSSNMVPQLQDSFGQSGHVQGGFNNGGAVQSTFGTGQGVQGGLDFSGATALPGTNDFGAEGKRLADASYGQATSRLDPQFQQQQSDLSSRLANSGIPVGSEAYTREMDNFGRTRTDAYNQADFSAQQAGANEQSRLFGLALNARQQGVGETQAAGQFANSAAGQQFGQNEAAATFGNQSQNQRYTQNMGAATFGNQAQQQRFDQNQAGAQFTNDARTNQFNLGQQSAGFDNQTQNQQFNQNLTNANMQNSSRQQQISEATYLRNLPLNEIAALMGTGGSVSQPNFSQVPQVGVAAPDYQGGVYNTYNAQNQQYMSAQQARSQAIGSIFGALGSLGGAAITASDRRIKENIVRIGSLANGIATYAFNFIGNAAPQFGVMAQDVREIMPDAVHDIDGVLHVDYGKVFA